MSFGNIFILGDSYSTFENYIPEGHACWYFEDIIKDTDVCKVEQTWWMQLIKKTDSNLVMNNSWSGSTICHTGWQGDNAHNSFITRIDRLIEDGYFDENKIDTLFIFGGTNDSWCDAPIGQLVYSDWSKENLYSVLPAFCYLLKRLKDNLSNTRIICLINCDLKEEITLGFKSSCENYGVEYLQLKNIEKQSGHPNISGMTQICAQIEKI